MNNIRVGVIRLGYVGLPLAVCSTQARFEVLRFDNNKNISNAINKVESLIKDFSNSSLSKLVNKY